jgi:hypothetical protein
LEIGKWNLGRKSDRIKGKCDGSECQIDRGGRCGGKKMTGNFNNGGKNLGRNIQTERLSFERRWPTTIGIINL